MVTGIVTFWSMLPFGNLAGCGSGMCLARLRRVSRHAQAGRGLLRRDVPAERVQACFTLVENAAALLVLGSSLTVMSGRRFVLRVARHGIPVAIVNQGETRADDRASVCVDAPLGEVLSNLAKATGALGSGYDTTTLRPSRAAAADSASATRSSG